MLTNIKSVVFGVNRVKYTGAKRRKGRRGQLKRVFGEAPHVNRERQLDIE